MAKENNTCEITFKQGTKKIVVNFVEEEDKTLSYTTDMSKFGEIENTSAKIALSLANFFLMALSQTYKQTETTSSEETPVETTTTSEE